MDYIRIYESKSGGYVDLHPLHGEDELADNAEACRILADHGYAIELLPYLPDTRLEARHKWLADIFGTKNPDIRINSKWIGDIKTPDSRRIRKQIISRNIYDAARQKAQVVIINLNHKEYSFQDIKRGIVGALQPERNKCILFVYIITRLGNLFIVDRRNVFDDTMYEILEIL